MAVGQGLKAICCGLLVAAATATPVALAADAYNGERLARRWCGSAPGFDVSCKLCFIDPVRPDSAQLPVKVAAKHVKADVVSTVHWLAAPRLAP